MYLHCVCHRRHDIFVFMDAYVQSQFKGPNVNRDMETRFSWVYRKSALAMLISSTTGGAFLCYFGTPLRTRRQLASLRHS